MANRRHKPEEVATKLQQLEVLVGQLMAWIPGLPFSDTHAMQLHLDEISRHVARGAHSVLLLDRAGWHATEKLKVPCNITPIFLPSRSPELNSVENVWRHIRQNWLSNRVFKDYDAIIDAACDAWKNSSPSPRQSCQ